jgi:ribonuclease E
MSKRMLIDASHPEETRVVVLDGNRVEEFDFEAASRRPLKGNIYLAKVTRVEPSLQAAFVEYGGNRQGFLAFSEIHPDYYQIPVADRQALLADQSRRLMEEDEEIDSVSTSVGPSKPGVPVSQSSEDDSGDETNADEGDSGSADAFDEADDVIELEVAEHQDAEASEDESVVSIDIGDDTSLEADSETAASTEAASENDDVDAPDDNTDGEAETSSELQTADEPANVSDSDSDTESSKTLAESTGTPEAAERKSRRRRTPRRKQYKIQEVIRRKQIILVQVVKEERGNKGASLTTYLSLAGRYCVLMPNTPRGGGISRKITSATDRKRLKSAAQSLELPEGMGLIIRTAGANRTKAEIRRDYEYLLRLWDTVRELTLSSNAPALVYEEGNLIKRTIRDLYGKEVSEVTVDGETGYRDAKEFMRMIMPSHAKNVKLYKDGISLFQRHQVEAQLDEMFSPVVTLKSGGYIVINQTEALVSIDVNSGKATREHSIEETARKTNLEAADEIARQLRLRDLAGLVVIDFIDMEDGKNDRSVEKRLRDALRNDRARIQIGKISQFGLLEMSRQRLRAGVLAGSTLACPHCEGRGYIRSTESASLQLLRALDEEGQQQNAASLIVRAPEEIILYMLNNKRPEISRIEQTYEMSIAFEPKDDMSGGTYDIERVGKRTSSKPRKKLAVSVEAGFQDQEEEKPAEPDESVQETSDASAEAEQSGDGGGRKRRRRRRRGGRGRNQQNAGGAQSETKESPAEGAAEDVQTSAPDESAEGTEPKRRRRRRGRRGRRPDSDSRPSDQGSAQEAGSTPGTAVNGGDAQSTPVDAKETADAEAGQPDFEASDTPDRSSLPANDEPARSSPSAAIAANTDQSAGTSIAALGSENEDASGPPRKGWWQRKLGI